MKEHTKTEAPEALNEEAIVFDVTQAILRFVRGVAQETGVPLCTLEKSLVGSVVANVAPEHTDCMIRRLRLDLSSLEARSLPVVPEALH